MEPNYNVVVLELEGVVRERYLEFRREIEDPRLWKTRMVGIDTGGVSYSPSYKDIDKFVNPAIVVCTKNEIDGGFPAFESIVGYVVVNRLEYEGVVRVLVPRGLTKTPVGHGGKYGYSFDTNLELGLIGIRPDGDGSHYKVAPAEGGYWAKEIAKNIFTALTITYPRAALMTRFATGSHDTVNPFITKLAATVFKGRTSLGFKHHVGLANTKDVGKVKRIMSKWRWVDDEGEVDRHMIHRFNRFTEIKDGNVVWTDERNPAHATVFERERHNRRAILGLGAKGVLYDGEESEYSSRHELTAEDIEAVDRLCIRQVKVEYGRVDPKTKGYDPAVYIPSRIVVDDRVKTLRIDDVTISYAGDNILYDIFRWGELFTSVGMFFTVYPSPKGFVRRD